ncbi:MAG: phosphatidylserine/phosphatidylglycerophosphate/cardiolipin synthase family protein [Alphaproteobacteria bacterium]|nr:phosphatidylserine/phosphatidylglycerophosphate/cardiolipin synthase family protein [Alphaproteobacteria bacterium]
MSRIWPLRPVTTAPALPELQAQIDGHRLTVMVDSDARLTALITLIATAQKSLRLVYYIFEADRVGEQVRNALIAAAKRGVAVTLLLDGFGCSRLPQAFLVPLTEAGAMVDRFLPKKGRRYLLRNHQKLAVADEARALIGGANISEEYFSADPAAQGWHDLSLLIEGPQAGALARYVDALHIWMRTRRQSIRHLQAVLAASSDHQGPLRWIMGGPFERLNPFARALRADLDGAQRVDMVQAYFAPDFTFLRRLARVARRGRLRVITAAQSDNVTTIAAARHCYGRLLREGAGIYEYRPARLHMKLIVSDNMVYIGSANYDTRSIFLNVELMLRVEDAGFAEKMRGLCADHLPHCQKIDRIWLKRVSGRFRKLRWALAYFLFTSVDYTITRRFNIGPDRRTWRLTDVKAKAH